MNDLNAIGRSFSPEQLANSPDTKATRLIPGRSALNVNEAALAELVQRHWAVAAEATVPETTGLAVSQVPEAVVPVVPEVPEPVIPVVPEVPVVIEPVVPEAPEEEDAQILPVPPRRRIWPKILATVALLALAVGGTLFLHFHSCENAATLANRSRYTDARDALFLPVLTQFHDPDFLPYLDAGAALEAGDYDQVRSILSDLSNPNYRRAAIIRMDADYFEGREAMKRGDFSLAVSYLEPLAKQKHRDSSVWLQEAQYQVAMRALGSGDYDLALQYLELLAATDYEDSATLLLEISYQKGAEALAQGNFRQAMSYLENLIDRNYSNSLELYCQAKLGCAVELISHEQNITDMTSGLTYLKQLIEDNYTQAKAPYDAARKAIYGRAIQLYESGNLTSAASHFSIIRDYSRTEDYLTLCKAHEYEVSLEDLWKLRGFADANQLLLTQDYLCQFLMGHWTTSNDTYYCTMESGTNGFDYYFSYNLPWQYNGNFQIVDGIYQVFHNGGSPQNEFRFTIVSWDRIQVYCYKNGSTYYLNRQ